MTPSGCPNIGVHLTDGFIGEMDGLALALARHPDTRDVALQFARDCFLESSTFHTMFRHLQLLELLGEISDPVVADYLLQESQPFEFGTNIVGRRAAAIRALGKHDREAAYEAALSALRTAKNDRHFYPKLLLDLDRDRTIPILCEHAVGESDPKVDRAICVALRHRCQPEQVESHLGRLLSGNADNRSAAAMIIGWMGNGFLTQRLVEFLRGEELDQVRRVALQAIAAQEAEPFGTELLERLKSSTGAEQWCLCDALFDLLEPEVLGHKTDSLWIGPVFDDLPPILQEHVKERHKDAKKQIERDHQLMESN